MFRNKLIGAIMLIVALHLNGARGFPYWDGMTYVFDVNKHVTLPLPLGISHINEIDLKFVFGGVKACVACAETHWGSGMMCQPNELMLAFTDPAKKFVGPPKATCGCSCGGVTWKADGSSWTFDNETADADLLRIPFCHVEYNQTSIELWYTEDLIGKDKWDNTGATQFYFFLDYDLQPFCGDGLCASNEGCGCPFLRCEKDCAGVDMDCPAKVPILAQNLTGPATLRTKWDWFDPWALWVDVQVPKAIPTREHVTFAFVEPKSGKQVGSTFPAMDRECVHQFQGRFKVSELIAKYKPVMVTTAEQYLYQFDIQARWSECYWLSLDAPVKRWRNDTLHFAVVVPRTITLASVVEVLCERDLWGYLAKGSIMLPHNSSVLASVHLELITEVQTPSYCIDPTTFKFSGPAIGGHIISVTNPVQIGSSSTTYAGSCLQNWAFDVVFNDSGICSLSGNDQMKFVFTIKSCNGQYYSQYSGSLVAGLGGLENFCSVNQTARLLGTQYTFDGETVSAQETHYFFCGQTVYVRDLVLADCLNVSNTSVQQVVLRGPALKPQGSETADYPLLQSNGYPTWLGIQVGFCRIPCPTQFPYSVNWPNWACYKFTLPCCSTLACGNQMTIETGLQITVLPQTGKRAAAGAIESETSQSMSLTALVSTGVPESHDADAGCSVFVSVAALAFVALRALLA